MSYYDGRRFYFQWEGRRLTQLTLSNVVTTFEYNADGLRTNKTTGGVSHDYIWSGDTLLAEVTDDYILRFIYDASGNVLGFEYLTPETLDDGITYYYEKNIFGDVVAIYDEYGTKVGAYGFNSYGQNHVVTNLTDDNIASLNPIRYRSYYYDADIYLYYLQTRYYDPVTCRFINADYSLNANGDILGFNMFAYCSNNPVMFADPSGESFALGISATAAKILLAVAVVCIAVALIYKISESQKDAAPPTIASPDINFNDLVDMDKLLKRNNSDDKKIYTVYALYDEQSKTVQYIGRTKNPKKRKIAHQNSATRGDLVFHEIHNNLTYVEARALEEMYMMACHTLTTLRSDEFLKNNLIHGIAPNNPKSSMYFSSVRFTQKYAANAIEDRILNWAEGSP